MSEELKPCKICRHCSHSQKWEVPFSIGRFSFYCGAIKSNRTANKLKKIKLKNLACGLFKGVEDE